MASSGINLFSSRVLEECIESDGFVICEAFDLNSAFHFSVECSLNDEFTNVISAKNSLANIHGYSSFFVSTTFFCFALLPCETRTE